MKKCTIILVFLSLLAASVYSQECGIDRWKIKTVRDKDARQIKWTAVSSTVSQQCALPRTIQHWKTDPRQTEEKQLYKIRCKIIGLGKEPDNDFHVIVQDMTTKETMVVEIPDPTCQELANTKLAPKYAQARSFLTNLYGEPGAIKKVKPKNITIYGVGFWEKLNHGQGHSTDAWKWKVE
ncbi:MAG: hypothetical protein ABI763_12305 [Bacteroidota bacterium]